jgi:hypothetical protein
MCGRHSVPGRPRGSGVTPVADRFWVHVERLRWDECWPWTGAKSPMSKVPGLFYGRFVVREGELEQEKTGTLLAHRVAFRLVHGRWPQPNALHGCDTPLCCNAENLAHIHEGTLKDNTREMFERGRGHLPIARLGIDASRAKLSDDQAREIIARYRVGGVSQAVLAAEYGVAQPSISAIVRGRRKSLGLGR